MFSDFTPLRTLPTFPRPQFQLPYTSRPEVNASHVQKHQNWFDWNTCPALMSTKGVLFKDPGIQGILSRGGEKIGYFPQVSEKFGPFLEKLSTRKYE